MHRSLKQISVYLKKKQRIFVLEKKMRIDLERGGGDSRTEVEGF